MPKNNTCQKSSWITTSFFACKTKRLYQDNILLELSAPQWLIGWLIDCLVDWLIAWLIGWWWRWWWWWFMIHDDCWCWCLQRRMSKHMSLVVLRFIHFLHLTLSMRSKVQNLQNLLGDQNVPRSESVPWFFWREKKHNFDLEASIRYKIKKTF